MAVTTILLIAKKLEHTMLTVESETHKRLVASLNVMREKEQRLLSHPLRQGIPPEPFTTVSIPLGHPKLFQPQGRTKESQLHHLYGRLDRRRCSMA